ncbi:MAG: NmrA family NAD(P)-binding protein, partial [Anaerolineae bacterium]|nr:NmrA family NAD(P)-binding protein [Anaerolineae bacterium]
MERRLHPAIDAAQAAGVKQIVFLSLMGVNPRVPHYKVEQKILATGLPYTFVRPSFYMQNLDTFYRDDIRLRDELFVPAGGAKTSFIDVRDIGAVAAMALAEPG